MCFHPHKGGGDLVYEYEHAITSYQLEWNMLWTPYQFMNWLPNILRFWVLSFQQIWLLMDGDLWFFVFPLMKNDINGSLMLCEEF
jgi:hypothetical protein